MVRINLISPRSLSDQHLIAEYNEILMLLGYVKKFPSLDGLPERYSLGGGHIRFFKNKLKYLEKRHRAIVREMRKRNFSINRNFDLRLKAYVQVKDSDEYFRDQLSSAHMGDWIPREEDIKIIKKRIIDKIKLKPKWYRYYGENKNLKFFKELMNG